ncbi:hypothetical protein Tco_0497136 [Tanacetum coccineum]
MPHSSPTIYTSLIEQFWQTASLCIINDRVLGITATIDRKVKITVLEGSIRRNLKLEDSEGIPSLPTAEIFEQLALMGYVTTSDSLTFQKGHFSPQWKFFIHTILHCLSPKKTAWEQFSSNIATAIICLATNRTFNFSKFIFNAMLEKNVKTSKARRRARIVISEDEDAAEDSSKQGRKISDIDTDPTISLVQPQQDMEYDFDATATVTTTSASISTVSPPRVSTAEDISGAETLFYIKRSASKAKDKGKAIMQESEPPKKINKRV